MGSCCGVSAEVKAQMGETSFWGRVEKIKTVLSAWPFLVISGVALVASFFYKDRLPVDPAIIPLTLCGLPILKEALEALIVEKRIRASLLISAAMISCVVIGHLFAAGEVAFIMALGEKLEAFTIRRARQGLRKLVSLVPATVRKVVTCPKCRAKGIFYKDIPVEGIEVGELAEIRPGETIPVDGVVTEGVSSVDQSVMTGESLPVDKIAGDEVYSGTINRFGTITIRVTKVGADSSLQKLIRLVKEAQTKKAPMQRIADRWATILVPCAMVIAIITFFGVWACLGDIQAALIRGVTILVVFCPCALALATPTAIMAAIGQATKYGVIVKSGEALEQMGSVDLACFDKTGTLTTGELQVAEFTDDEVLAFAAAVEAKSEHPLAKAICARKPSSLTCTDFMMVPGRGVKGTVDGKVVLCGTAAWLGEHGVAVGKALAVEENRCHREGRAVVLVAVDGSARGFVALSDTVRTVAANVLTDLKASGVQSCLLTGDHAAAAQYVADRLGVAEVRAGLLPAEKAQAIEKLQADGKICCMVGDGVNDAVALKTARVGIAMGGAGSDIAVEAADIALVGDDLSKIAYLKRLSVACVKLIKLNIGISMGINAVAITCSILGILGPVSGALVHNVGSALVVLNAALLYDRKFR